MNITSCIHTQKIAVFINSQTENGPCGLHQLMCIRATGTLFISVISDNRHRVLLLLLIFICTSGPKDLYQTSL